MIRIFSIAAVLLLAAALPVSASPACMTLEEARAHYPTTWLYWHTQRHCWNNRRSVVRIAARRSVRVPLPEVRPELDDPIWPDPSDDFSFVDRWPDERAPTFLPFVRMLESFGHGKEKAE